MCELIDKLKIVKKSSNESIDNDKIFTSFKRFMHVERCVQRDLESILQKTRSLKKALVLVCGNVGDGKSHLISYLKNETHYLDDFFVHNDATESYGRNQTEKQALAQVLSEFSDDNLNSGSVSKVIVAINLGILSNFLDSPEGSSFSKLRAYVTNCHVLVEGSFDTFGKESNTFFHVNFADYHLYRLNNGSVDSPYIDQILNKIFGDSPENPFFKAYRDGCGKCPYSEKCPVKTNYECMCNDTFRKGLIRILIETILKDKLIVSTRELLNFIYDITVHPAIVSDKYKGDFKIDYLLPNLLYDHSDLSELLFHVSKYDIVKARWESLDIIISCYVNALRPVEMYDRYISPNACQSAVKKYLNESGVQKAYGSELKLFLRLLKLTPTSTFDNTENEEYYDYIKYLYASARGDRSTIKQLSQKVKSCIYIWNGSEDKKRIILREIDDLYTLSTELTINAGKAELRSDCTETIFDKFSEKIPLKFSVNSGGIQKNEVFYIDYELYEMLVKIYNGFKVSSKEASYYAAFFSFVRHLITYSNYKKEITITSHENDKARTFQIVDDSDDDEHYYRFEEVT